MFIARAIILVAANVPSFLFMMRMTHAGTDGCGLYERYNDRNFKCIDYEWCLYKFYAENKSWFEAKAICEEGNMTLAHITNHTYVYNLMKSSLPAMFANPPDSVWVGAYRACDGEVKWQDDCSEVDASFLGDGHDLNEACFVLANSSTLDTGSCSTQLPFLCQASSLDIDKCFTTTQKIPDASKKDDVLVNSIITPSDCYPECILASGCVGIKCCSSENCELITLLPGKTYGKGKLYINDLLRTSDTANVTASISDLQNICSGLGTSPNDQRSNQQTLGITPTKAFVSTTADITTTATSTLMGSSHLEFISSEPVTVTKQTSDSTPPLTNTVTSVNLEMTSLPTETETLSMTCSHCACTKSSSIGQEELEESISKLKEQLRVNPKELSSFKRKLTSAPDDRQSAANIGYVGALLLCIIPGLIILLDMGRLTREFKQFISHLRNSHRATANVAPH